MEAGLLSSMGVYKANQCVDLNDCKIALDKLEEIKSNSRGLGCKMYWRRKISLEKRAEQLKKKYENS